MFYGCAICLTPCYIRTDFVHLAPQTHSALAIFKCAEDAQVRVLVRKHGGLKPLVARAQQVDQKDVLWSATGAIWKCAKDPDNIQELSSLKAVESLVSLLTSNQVWRILRVPSYRPRN